ncbi:MAG: hypothetical protein ACYCT6_08900 [bacterium]
MIFLTAGLLSGCATTPEKISLNKISKDFSIKQFKRMGNVTVKNNKIIRYNSNGEKIAEYNLRKLGVPNSYIEPDNSGGLLNIFWKGIALGNNNILVIGCTQALIPHAFGKPASPINLGIIEELSKSGKFLKSFYVPQEKYITQYFLGMAQYPSFKEEGYGSCVSFYNSFTVDLLSIK